MSNTELDEQIKGAKWGADILDEQTYWTMAENVRAVVDALEAAEQKLAAARSEQIKEDAAIAECVVPIVDDSVMEAHAKNIGMVIAAAIRAQLEVQS